MSNTKLGIIEKNLVSVKIYNLIPFPGADPEKWLPNSAAVFKTYSISSKLCDLYFWIVFSSIFV